MSSVPTTDPIIDKAISMARRGFSEPAIRTVVGRYMTDAAIASAMRAGRSAAHTERMAAMHAANAAEAAKRQTERNIIAMYREVPIRAGLTVSALIDRVAGETGLPRKHILDGGRQRQLVAARHKVMYLAVSLTTMSLPQIGRAMGGLDHTSILHGVRAHCLRNNVPLPRGMTIGTSVARMLEKMERRDRCLQHVCSVCGAGAGLSCIGRRGNQRVPHFERIQAVQGRP